MTINASTGQATRFNQPFAIDLRLVRPKSADFFFVEFEHVRSQFHAIGCSDAGVTIDAYSQAGNCAFYYVFTV